MEEFELAQLDLIELSSMRVPNCITPPFRDTPRQANQDTARNKNGLGSEKSAEDLVKAVQAVQAASCIRRSARWNMNHLPTGDVFR